MQNKQQYSTSLFAVLEVDDLMRTLLLRKNPFYYTKRVLYDYYTFFSRKNDFMP